jgi:carboxyl-terminal processing protease
MGEGQTYALTVERAGQPAPLKLSLTTGRTQVDPVEYKVVGGKIGYLRIRQFNSKATDEFEAALNKAEGLKGLILDLRQNPGGVTAEARTSVDGYSAVKKLIARLTPGGAVGALERKPKQRETLTVTPTASALKIPLVVLVDGGTANLAELTASALREAGKARLVGEHTFGDNVLQLFALLKNGAGVELTAAHLFTVRGMDLARGLEPDVPVNAASGGGRDEALARALAMM